MEAILILGGFSTMVGWLFERWEASLHQAVKREERREQLREARQRVAATAYSAKMRWADGR